MVEHTGICSRDSLQPDAVLTIDSDRLAVGDTILSQHAAQAVVRLTVAAVSQAGLEVSDFSGATVALRPWQAGDDARPKFGGDRSDWTVA